MRSGRQRIGGTEFVRTDKKLTAGRVAGVRQKQGTAPANKATRPASELIPKWIVYGAEIRDNGSASAPADYTAASGTLSWNDGDADPKTFTVAVNDRSSGNPPAP